MSCFYELVDQMWVELAEGTNGLKKIQKIDTQLAMTSVT